MEKILTQDDIDALFRAARGATPAKAKKAKRKSFKPCDFRQSGLLSKEQVQSITFLHENFAPNITNSVGAYLRGGFEASLVSIEQLTYAEFLGRLAELNYMSPIAVQPDDVQAGLQIDMPLIFPIIDLLLGGLGKAMPELRDLTEIEDQIIDSVVTIIVREMEATWKTLLPVEFHLGARLKQAQIQTFMGPAEKVLTLSFEIRLTEARGMLNFAFPGVLSALLLRKLAQQGSLRRRSNAEMGARLRERLMNCPFSVELVLPGIPARIGDLIELKAGQVLPLHHSVHAPMNVVVAGKPLFSGVPVSCGNMRGGLIQDVVVPASRAAQANA